MKRSDSEELAARHARAWVPPDVKDVKDLCFGTLDMSQLPSPASCYDSGVADADNFSRVGSYELEVAPGTECYPSEEFTTEDEDEDDKHEDDNKECKHYYSDVLDYRSTLNFGDEHVRGMVLKWIGTWEELDERPWTWISVNAYYSKKKGHGGYGVILRDAVGKPIIAAAKFSKTGVSFYCQLFKGINEGVKLAEARGLSGFHVLCNSIRAPSFFLEMRNCSDNKCINASDIGGICQSCCVYVHINERYARRTVLSLLHSIRQKVVDLDGSWGLGLAEHYVAKMEKKKIVEAEEERSDTAYEGSVLKPAQCPIGLKNILFTESVGLSKFLKMKGGSDV